MNAIELLIQQHQNTREALAPLIEGYDLEPSELRRLADELVAHMVIEEHLFYPYVRAVAPDLIEESFEQHAVARFELARLILARGDAKRARAKVLLELVHEHIESEEHELFPEVARRVDEADLDKLGTRMEAMFDKAVDAGYDKLVVASDQTLRSGPSDPAKARRGRATAPAKRAPRSRAPARRMHGQAR